MKRTILVGILGLVTSGTCIGANLLRPEIRCSTSEFSEMKFGAICNNGTADITVYGMAHCAAIPGEKLYDSSETKVEQDSDPDENIHCWCHMADPFVSSYVFINSYLYANECTNWCASACAQAIKSDTGFRTAIFSNLKNK